MVTGERKSVIILPAFLVCLSFNVGLVSQTSPKLTVSKPSLKVAISIIPSEQNSPSH
jgi:hypothetical protein